MYALMEERYFEAGNIQVEGCLFLYMHHAKHIDSPALHKNHGVILVQPIRISFLVLLFCFCFVFKK